MTFQQISGTIFSLAFTGKHGNTVVRSYLQILLGVVFFPLGSNEERESASI